MSVYCRQSPKSVLGSFISGVDFGGARIDSSRLRERCFCCPAQVFHDPLCQLLHAFEHLGIECPIDFQINVSNLLFAHAFLVVRSRRSIRSTLMILDPNGSWRHPIASCGLPACLPRAYKCTVCVRSISH